MSSRTPVSKPEKVRPPSAMERFEDIRARIGAGRPVLFLDYDGTLTPIVDDPEKALLERQTRELLISLKAHIPVAVISGRDLPDVQKLVGIPDIYYAGSHGFDIVDPEGKEEAPLEASGFPPLLEKAEKELSERMAPISGAWIERKKFSIAIHFRKVDKEAVESVRNGVKEMAARYPDLRQTGGKKVFELQPDMDWHKGRALYYLLDRMHLDKPDVVPLYIGDDTTDEDAFHMLKDRGVGIVVMDRPRSTEAHYRLRDPGEVKKFLNLLLTSLQSSTPMK